MKQELIGGDEKVVGWCRSVAVLCGRDLSSGTERYYSIGSELFYLMLFTDWVFSRLVIGFRGILSGYQFPYHVDIY